MVLQDISDTGLRRIRGNEPLILSQPDVVWVVQSGSLALFSSRLVNGLPEGERRYLINAYPGDALFSIHPDETEQLVMIAVALETTDLRPMDIDQALGLDQPDSGNGSANGDRPVDEGLRSSVPARSLLSYRRALLDGWIHKLGQINHLPQPQLSGLVPQNQFVALMKGQICQSPANQVSWINVRDGKASWLGMAELSLDNHTGCFPMGERMWLQAEEHVEFFVRSTSEISSRAVLVKGLAQLHRYFFRCIQQIAEQEMQAAILQFQARQKLNFEVTQETIQNLASILYPDRSGFKQTDSPLLIAAGAVGRALGVAIEPPMRSEDLSRVGEPLEAIARASRLRLRRVLLRDRWWEKDGGPILAYTRMDHYPVALLPVGGDRYELFNPVQVSLVDVTQTINRPDQAAKAARTPIDARVAATLDPVAYVFYRPLPDGVLKATDLLKFVIRGRQSDLISILFTGVAATILGMLVPQATAVLIDKAIPYGNTGLLAQIGLALLAAALGSASFQLGQAIVSLRLETLSDASLQAAVWDRLLKLRTSFFRQYAVGDLNSRVSGISAIRRRLSGTVLQTLFASFFSLLNLGLLFYYSPTLATLALVVALIVGVVTVASGVLLLQKHRPLIELEGDIFGLMVQLINGVPKLRLAGAEERAFAHWGQKYTQQLKLTLSTQRLEDSMALFNTVMPTLTTVALFWLASTLIDPTQPVGGAGLSTGAFWAFNIAFGTFIGGVTNLSNTITEVLEVVPFWQRSQPILKAQPEVDLDKADPGRLSGQIHIDHVTFRYREDGPLILDDVTVHAEPGEFIAFVGPSGSGKSTILRLLLGFETPISGGIYYDGQDLMGLDVTAVRRQLGVVLQNSRINASTIFENIASGALITLEDAWAAAEMAGLADDVHAMPMQMHTLISEGGTNLSGGQRQRLIIARALALHPRILFLDEATSALDNRTQAIVSQSLERLNVTRIAIAHRLSTIRHADRIYVLEAGRIIQQGSFAELAAQPGLFAQLIKRQLA
jgi:NHLM bacteriocin system ABC transporter ATP-binding protein